MATRSDVGDLAAARHVGTAARAGDRSRAGGEVEQAGECIAMERGECRGSEAVAFGQ